MPDHDPIREELQSRYRAYRPVLQRHLNDALALASPAVIREATREIGLIPSDPFNPESALYLVYDLVVFGEKPGQARAIDRYARKARPAGEGLEAETLAALRQSRFHILQAVRRHDHAGTIARDHLRKQEVWLLDEGLESSWKIGTFLATRLVALGGFSTTAGVFIPVDEDVLADAMASRPSWRKEPHQILPDDPQLPQAVYAAAIAHGQLRNVDYRD